MTKRTKRFGIKARTCTTSGAVKMAEHFFVSDAARERWIEKAAESGRLVEIVAWSYYAVE